MYKVLYFHPEGGFKFIWEVFKERGLKGKKKRKKGRKREKKGEINTKREKIKKYYTLNVLGSFLHWEWESIQVDETIKTPFLLFTPGLL